MSVRIYSPRLVWTPLTQMPQVERALEDALRVWEGTPYESGQRFPQRGADCLGSVFGVVDDLDGRQRAEYPGMPFDASMHDRPGAIAALREIVRRYSPCHKLEHEAGGFFLVQPGDIVVTGAPGGGPGHVEIVGANRNELWHSTPSSGFHQGGWSMLECQVLWAVYRIEDKSRWL